MNPNDLIKNKEKGCGLRESLGSPICEEDCLCDDCNLELKALKQMNKLWEDKLKEEGIIFLAGEICFDEKASPKFAKWLDKLLDKREKATNKLWLDRIDDFDFMKEVNFICEGMKCPSNEKLHTKEDINKWVRRKLKSEDK